MKSVVLGGLALAFIGCSKEPPAVVPPASASATAAAPSGVEAKLRAALAGTHRSDKERARDAWRHPVETLMFFGLREDMTVLELWPGGGWFTAVLAPVLAERGKLIATNGDPNGDPKSYETKEAKLYLDRLGARRDVYGKVQIREVNALNVKAPEIDLGPEGSADLVVSFRSVHNWIDEGYEAKVFAAAFKVLKPGGVLGLTEHRAKDGADIASLKEKGYVPEAHVIKLAEAAGFKLEKKAEINANPKDTKDYAQGVWTLPPSFAEKDKDREKYAAIGESDRMTLKFVKR